MAFSACFGAPFSPAEMSGFFVKKALHILGTVLVSLLVVVAVFMMLFTIISVNTFDRNDRRLFGYQVYIVASDSMAATDFNAGDLIFVKEVDPTTLQEGDVITFVSQNADSYNQPVTHKIRRLTTDANGNPGFVTYGTTTGVDDETVVTYPYVLGRYTFRIQRLGDFFHFLKQPQGYIVCIFVPFVLLILHQGIKSIRLFRRYKREEMEEMEEEKRKLESERAENARMMAELESLRAQLQQQPTPPDDPTQGGTST